MGNCYYIVLGFGCYFTRDGDIVLLVQMDPLWRCFCVAVGWPELAIDLCYATVFERQWRFVEVEVIVAGVLVEHDVEEWLVRLCEVGVLVGFVMNLFGVLEGVYVRLCGFVQEFDQFGAGCVCVLALVVCFVGDAALPVRPALVLGADTCEQFVCVGLDFVEIDVLC